MDLQTAKKRCDRPHLWALCLVAGLLTEGCGFDDPVDRPAAWDYLHTAIIEPSCATASCHSQLAQRAGMILEDADTAYNTLVEENFVVPGDPNSTLLFLLEGEERRLMPPDAPLPAADVDLIRAWVVSGAER